MLTPLGAVVDLGISLYEADENDPPIVGPVHNDMKFLHL
jgi:hypothetical protein